MKKFFNKIVLFLSGLFTNLDTWIHDHVQPSIELVQRLKSLVDSPVADVICALIPGVADDALKSLLSTSLQKALDAMNVVKTEDSNVDLPTKINTMLDYLKTISPAMQNAVYFKLAAEIAKAMSGTDSVKGHSVDLLVQMQYSKLKENIQASDLPAETLIDGEVQPAIEAAAPVIEAVAQHETTAQIIDAAIPVVETIVADVAPAVAKEIAPIEAIVAPAYDAYLKTKMVV